MEDNNVNPGAVDGAMNQQENQGEQVESKTFSQSEVDKMIASESDRRVAQALKTFKEKDLPLELERVKTEAEKLATMTQEQKVKHEREQYESQLKQREMLLTQKELKIEAHNLLNERSLPIDLLDILDYSNADSLNNSIVKVEKSFNDSLEKKVNERLKGNPPIKPNSTNTEKTYAEKLADAKNNGDMLKIIQIKREASENGEYLL